MKFAICSINFDCWFCYFNDDYWLPFREEILVEGNFGGFRGLKPSKFLAIVPLEASAFKNVYIN